MKLAYLTGQYPKVSHTFVRREILGLEALGHQVIRLSVREADSGVVDPLDIEELDKTKKNRGSLALSLHPSDYYETSTNPEFHNPPDQIPQ